MDYKRVLAVGDIHGEWEKFMSLYEKIHFNPDEDLLIFLGDYIDRGNGSLRVLDWMYEHRNEKNIIMLRGNHEQMMLDYYRNGDEIWIWNGGDKSRKGLARQKHGILEECLAFLKSLPLYHRMEINGHETIFCHGGFLPNIPLEEQTEEEILWVREEFYDSYEGDALVVIGHTPVVYLDLPPVPTRYGNKNIIMVDTGSFLPNGFVSCVDILTGDFIQSDVRFNKKD